MKCTSIKLVNRKDYQRKLSLPNDSSKSEGPYYVTKGYPGYCYRFSPTKFIPGEPQMIGLAIRNLTLPDNVKLNCGTSLRRWSKKTPRLRSSKTQRSKSPDISDESDNISFNLTSILDNVILDDSENSEVENDYDLNSEIADSKSDQNANVATNDGDVNIRILEVRQQTKRIKNDLKKTIRFSFSKPASPQTEQVIRVDVTSSVSLDHFDNEDSSMEHEGKRVPEQRASKITGVEGEEDFIVKCRQLALTQKKR
ncbi:uncharacterized protein LOC132697263 [Cylas formicarius]|uniref:uncharacterized protein LOC132697263 n=1 Tax=Cylas formicarius TaxID=197179 RepID=UPI002958D7BF|nr:uncharacterized protein LOC132697263 [Cylas formicarius]